MKLHEYQSKELFKSAGIPIPRGKTITQPGDASGAFAEIQSAQTVIKAQVLTGGRGKAGGIQMADSAGKAVEVSRSLIGNTLKTYQSGNKAFLIRSVLIEEVKPIAKEMYMGIAVNRGERLPNLIFSEAGGMEIEELARKEPAKVQRIAFGPSGAKPEHFASSLKLSPELEKHRGSLSQIASQLAGLYVAKDLSVAEINPLVITDSGHLVALDAKAVVDDNALFRHPDLAALKDPDEDDPKETRAKKSSLSYVSLSGNIGCLVNGAGLAMTTMDAIKFAGGEPANFLDVGGGATKEQVLEGFRIILDDKHVKAVFVNIFGGIMKCDVIAQALLDAATEIGIDVPVIVRLEGTRVEEGRKLLREARIKLHAVSSIFEGAERSVALAQKQGSR